MTLVNPLHYPLAVFLGVVVWVWFWPRLVALPAGVLVTLTASWWLQQQVQQLRQQVQALVPGVARVRAEAARLLAETPAEVCDQVQTLPQAVEQQLAQVRRQQRQASLPAAVQFKQLAALATLVQATAAVLQQLHNHLRAIDLDNQRQVAEVRTLSDTLRSLEQPMTILTRR